MIKIKISELLGKHKMNQKMLSQKTNIRPATISSMYHEDTKRIDIKQIESLCKALDCNVGDLLEYIPDEE